MKGDGIFRDCYSHSVETVTLSKYVIVIISIIIISIIIIKKGRQCKAEREWYTPISPKTPAPQYQPIDRKKRNGKRVEDYSRDRAA